MTVHRPPPLGTRGMTLAAIFLSLSFALRASSLQAMPAFLDQSPATTGQDTSQGQSNSQPQNPSTSQPSPSSKTTSDTTGTTSHPPLRHKKKVMQPNCNPATAGASATTQTASTGKPGDTASANGNTSNSPSGKTSASSNCPPSKVIVRQGGTSEPAIQLAGGDDSSKTRGDAAQNLATAEANLQKISGRDLTPGQRDMVTQIGKFIDQSKAATAAGDLERARTLAWKAQTLSEELVNPQK